METSRRRFLAAPALLAGVPGAAPGANLQVGFVNVRSCFEKEKYGRVAETMEQLHALRNTMAQEAAAIQKTIADLTALMEGLPRTAELYLEKLRLRSHAEYDLKLLQEVLRRRIRERLGDLEGKVCADIRRALGPLARELGLDLILRTDDPRGAEEDLEGAPAPRPSSREVLFPAEAADLTPQVLARLNAQWARAWTCAACKRKVVEPACPDCGAKPP